MSISDTFTTTPRSIVKNLVQILHDGQEGFRTASESVKDSQLNTLFSRLSLQRSKFAGELESELLTLGEEDPQNEGGTVSGAIHRTWIDLKSAITKQDDHAVLAEAERGEDSAVAAYKHALEHDDLPKNLQTIITAQATEVKRAHDEVKALRDATKKK
jgi:uncharacterized protein (TIGR02284 family)